jgi:hypothetical protein
MNEYSFSIQTAGLEVLRKHIGVVRSLYFKTQAIQYEDGMLVIPFGLSVKVHRNINVPDGWLNIFTQAKCTTRQVDYECLYCLYEPTPQFIELTPNFTYPYDMAIKGHVSEIDLNHLGVLMEIKVVYAEEVWEEEYLVYDCGLLFQFVNGNALLKCLPNNFEMKFMLNQEQIEEAMKRLKIR